MLQQIQILASRRFLPSALMGVGAREIPAPCPHYRRIPLLRWLQVEDKKTLGKGGRLGPYKEYHLLTAPDREEEDGTPQDQY